MDQWFTDDAVYSVKDDAPAGTEITFAHPGISPGSSEPLVVTPVRHDPLSLDEAIDEGLLIRAERVPLADADEQAAQEARERAEAEARAESPSFAEAAGHPMEVDAGSVAPPPPRGAKKEPMKLLTDEEFAVLDLLDEAVDRFVKLPQAEPGEREVFLDQHARLVDRVMRRAAIRAYPQRFVRG